MKHKISKVFFVIVMLLVLSLLAVACNDSQGNETDSDKYAVTYVGGAGATGTAPSGGEYAEGAKITLPDAGELTKADHTFGGWSYDGKTYAAGAEFTMPAKAVEFTAVWTLNQGGGEEQPTVYNVVFNPNNGTESQTVNVESGKKVAKPADDPVNSDGKIFRYWVNEATGEEYNFEAPVTSDMEITALFSWKVTFDANGASGSIAPIWVEKWVSPIELPNGNSLTNPGKVFDGWTDGTTDYAAGERFIGNKNHTLRAIWKDAGVTYTVTVIKTDSYSINESDVKGEVPVIENKAAGETFTVPATLSLAHYTQTKWRVQYLHIPTSQEGGGDPYWATEATYNVDEPIVMLAKNIRIVPVWTKNKVEISFDANGGTGTMSIVKKDYATNLALTTSAFDCKFTAPAGMEFAGWSNTPNGSVLANGTKLVEPLVSSDDKLTLYAIWENSEHPAFVNPVIAMEGKWTVAGHEFQIVADAAATVDSITLGYAVLDGVAYNVIISEGELFATSLDYNSAYGLTSNGSALTLTDLYNENAAAIVLDTKDTLVKKQISDFVGKWIKGSQQWVITESGAYYGLNLSKATVNVVGEYVVLYYEVSEYPYVHIMKQGDNNLTGYFCVAEKSPAAVTFEKGTYFTLTVNGVLNQTVNSGSAPNASKIQTPTAPAGQVFSKWVLAGTNTEFVLSEVMTEDASIEAKFENQTASAVKTYVGSALNVDYIEFNTETGEVVFYLKNGNTMTPSVTETKDGSFKYNSSNPTGSACWIVLSDDGNTLKIYDDWNGPDELQATYTLQA